MYKNSIIVSGDFNAPDISWDTEYSSQSPASDRLLEIILMIMIWVNTSKIYRTSILLILTIHDIASSLQQNKSIHAALLDFSKAFDKVPHQRLLMKLERYGIHVNLLSWMESFLTTPD